MTPTLGTEELVRLLRTVFRPRAEDRALALLVDLPDEARADHPAWAERRAIVADWQRRLRDARGELGLDAVRLGCYRNVRRNNADLPERAALCEPDRVPDHADRLSGEVTLDSVLRDHRLVVAVTELSATAPLKLAARRLGFRAATMPGFRREMVPALRLDYAAIDRRCREMKALLDRATGVRIRFGAAGSEWRLDVDLRHRTATASGGLLTEPGTAGNLPSGETYIVPYEGEREGDPSRTRGTLPLELDGELLFYRIEGNRVVEVLGDGPVAARERGEMDSEPGYRNVAELGLGLLADYGVRPIGEILLDEKLGLHLAFGRSDHFGGQVGAAAFSAPDKVVHVDRVYIPEVQPRVGVLAVDLLSEDGEGSRPILRDGRYV